jgi:hypothetical protein
VATGRGDKRASLTSSEAPAQKAIVLGSGNLGLIYLMERPHRLELEEIRELHPELLPALCSHRHVGFVMVRSAEHGAVAMGPAGTRRLADGQVSGVDPLRGFSPNAARHLLRTDGFEHVPDILVNSFYDPTTEEGCAFEELISFHGGLGGSQTQPFLLCPADLPVPAAPLVGAEEIYRILRGWREAAGRPPRMASAAQQQVARDAESRLSG